MILTSIVSLLQIRVFRKQKELDLLTVFLEQAVTGSGHVSLSLWASEFVPECSRGTTRYKTTTQEKLNGEEAGAGVGGR